MKNIIHWCKPKKMWTSHTYKSCAKSTTILVIGDWEVETKPNKKDNPRGWIKTEHTNVIVNPSFEQLDNYYKVEKMIYNKEKVEFSHTSGVNLLFDDKGCFIIEQKQ